MQEAPAKTVLKGFSLSLGKPKTAHKVPPRAEEPAQPRSKVTAFAEDEEAPKDEFEGMTHAQIQKAIATRNRAKDAQLEAELEKLRAEGALGYDEPQDAQDDAEEEEEWVDPESVVATAHKDINKPGLIILSKPKQTAEGPRYAAGMKKAAAFRQQEHDIIYQKNLQMEREEAKETEKEVFVTGAYKRHVAERQALVAQREREAKEENDPDRKRNVAGFMSNMLEQGALWKRQRNE